MTDLIRKSDAEAAIVGCKGNGATRQYCRDAIAALPAVTVGVIHEEQNTEQARVFWNWLPLAYRDGHLGEEAKFTKYNMEVAHYAGWCAGTRRDNTNAVDDSQPADPVVNAPDPAAIREAALHRAIELKVVHAIDVCHRVLHSDLARMIDFDSDDYNQAVKDAADAAREAYVSIIALIAKGAAE